MRTRLDATPTDPATADSAAREEASAVLPGSALDFLLQRLGTEDRLGESIYEELRRRLIVFFQLHVPAEAEALADATFDRLAHKLEEGTTIRDVRQYALGIARMLLLEARTRLAREQQAIHDPSLAPDYDEERSRRKELVFAALSECLEQLGPNSERLILAYYGEDGGGHIPARRKLALHFGISLNALKNRALRLRQTLERCVSQRLKPA
jgi:DNA-directed RNA polymerase specialized sigma24 family protein